MPLPLDEREYIPFISSAERRDLVADLASAQRIDVEDLNIGSPPLYSGNSQEELGPLNTVLNDDKGKDTKEVDNDSVLVAVGTGLRSFRDGEGSVHEELYNDAKQHKDHKDHKDGKDFKDGKDGKDGKDIKDGKDGKDFKDGKDGKDFKDGKDGKDTKDGKDGDFSAFSSDQHFRMHQEENRDEDLGLLPGEVNSLIGSLGEAEEVINYLRGSRLNVTLRDKGLII